MEASTTSHQLFEIVVVGTSWGGLRAMQTLLNSLPGGFAAPIIVVIHRDKGGDVALSELLQKHTVLRVDEVADKDPIQPGHVYLAPADYHLLVEEDHFALSTEKPVNYARPSIDVLFETAADDYGERVIGVILTGTMSDGAQGLAAIKRRGGLAIVQDPGTAEMPAMPEAAIAGTTVDEILPLEDIGALLAKRCVKHST